MIYSRNWKNTNRLFSLKTIEDFCLLIYRYANWSILSHIMHQESMIYSRNLKNTNRLFSLKTIQIYVSQSNGMLIEAF